MWRTSPYSPPDAVSDIEDPSPPEISQAADPSLLKNSPEWQQPLMPVFEEAAAGYNVPLDLLLTLAKMGSAFENRGDARTIEGGYGLMALRDNDLGGDSLKLASELTGLPREQLIADPAASIAGAAAVLNAYANEAEVDRSAGIEAWLPVVVKYAGLDAEDSNFFAYGFYELLSVGFEVTNSFGETFTVERYELSLDFKSLVPPGIKQIPLDVLEKGLDPAALDKTDKQELDYPGAIWDPAASCNYTATVTSKDTIIVHTIEGTAAGARSWMKNCASQVSSHYVISEAGTIWQMVDERYRAWHVGCLNSRSIGFEHEGYAASSSHPTSLYNASAALAKNICDRRGIIKAHRTCAPGILGHNDANNCHCGGTHWDPGSGWNWTYYINQINGTPPPPTWNATYKAQSYPSSMVAGSTATVWAEFTNTGTGEWKHSQTYLGTSSPQDRSSPFCNMPNWTGCNRPTDVDQSSVTQNQVGRFTFILKAPSTPGTYTEKFRLVREGVTWFGPEITWTITVTPATPPPTITAHPVAASVCAGGTATFSVTASGSGLSYQWQKNGSNLSNGGHYSGVTTATLTVSSASSADAASYRCVVTNAGGSATSNAAALTVRAATTITAQPTAQAVCPGGTASFSVTATGDGTLSYQWQKDGTNLAGATSATLQITNVSASDAGNYRCVVTGGCGSATSNAAALTLQTAPAITAQPQPQTVGALGTASFSVTATGSGLSYRWQKNGTNLNNGGKISGATSATLQIASVTSSDEGEYRCVVTGSCGTVTSAGATLTVVAILADDFQAYANQAAFEAVWADTGNSPYYLSTSLGNPGASVVMPSPSANYLGRYYRSLGAKYTGTAASPLVVSCDFWLDPAGAPNWTGARHTIDLRGYSGTVFGQGTIENLVAIGVHNNSADTFSTTRYQGRVVNGAEWQTLDEGSAPARSGGWHQLKIVITDSQIQFYVDGVLSETETRPNNYGFDWVVLGSDLTAAGFQAAVDNVVVSGGVILPEFTAHPQSQSLCAGGTASFSVAVSGSGPFSYRWQKDGVDLTDGGHYAGTGTATLVISGANANDAAAYRCRVSNADGQVTSNAANLTIIAPPTITAQPVAQAPCLGGTASFSVSASGESLSYQWQKDGTNIAGATSATLQISGVSAQDVGGYACVVTDGCNNSTTSSVASLTLNAAPSITGPETVELTVEKNSPCSAASNQVTLTATDTDTPAGSLVWSIVSGPSYGTASFVNGVNTGATVTVCYAPGLDQLSDDSLVVQVTDGCGGPDTVTINVTVEACPNLLVEDFNGYASQAAFEAVWLDTLNSAYYLDGAGGNPGGAVILASPSANNLGKYYRNLGGDFNGTDAAPLVLSFDFWLDPAGAPGWSGARHFVELRGYSGDEYGSGTLENLLAIGVYNSSADTFSTTRYQGRVVNGAGWQTLDEGSAPARAGGWHQLKIEVTSSLVKFYVDGILSETESRPNSYGFDCVVIGSDLTSAGIVARVDNLRVTCGQ
ncbi:MAG TPA: immunoglobulin domain-containing protein [Phycisphaerae bacterium]|nr:immunoglobulin domain-containing protein [Phycisphaerae bacterium]